MRCYVLATVFPTTEVLAPFKWATRLLVLWKPSGLLVVLALFLGYPFFSANLRVYGWMPRYRQSCNFNSFAFPHDLLYRVWMSSPYSLLHSVHYAFLSNDLRFCFLEVLGSSFGPSLLPHWMLEEMLKSFSSSWMDPALDPEQLSVTLRLLLPTVLLDWPP